MAGRKRLSKDERRDSIVTAAVPLFAKNGFRGTTTKELAAVAGVSEALLYKHFPSKESMYEEIQKECFRKRQDYVDLIDGLEPSPESLVFIVWFVLKRTICRGMVEDNVLHEALPRLVLNSILEDGEFARVVLVDNSANWRDLLIGSIKAAAQEGVIADPPAGEEALMTWIIHHVGFAAVLLDLPKKPVVDYGCDAAALLDSTARFLLRGLGMSDDTIGDLYKPAEFEKRLSE